MADEWKTLPLIDIDGTIIDVDEALYKRELLGTFTHDAVEIGAGRPLTREDVEEAFKQLKLTSMAGPIVPLSSVRGNGPSWAGPLSPSGRTMSPIVLNPPYAGRSKTMIGMQLAKARGNVQVSTLECDYDEIEARLQALKEKAAKLARIRMFRFDAEWFSE